MAIRSPFFGPLMMATLAAGMVGAVFLVPGHPRPVSEIIDLAEGATSELAFRTDADGGYQVELEMDQPVAKRLYPCVADVDTLASPSCDGPSMPLELSILIVGEGGNVVDQRFDSEGQRGGTFAGETFIILMNAGQLEPRTDYRLVVRSLRDGSALSPARPRLTVDIAPGRRESVMVTRALALVAAGALGIIALIWAAIAAAVQRSAVKAGRAVEGLR
ncbi:MAG: hypothetical protein HY859_02300 [Caulobacterales bacterium]|nr:hypothetical protein [Caulobacterales bacterium]